MFLLIYSQVVKERKQRHATRDKYKYNNDLLFIPSPHIKYIYQYHFVGVVLYFRELVKANRNTLSELQVMICIFMRSIISYPSLGEEWGTAIAEERFRRKGQVL